MDSTDLLARMTLCEKAAQLNQRLPGWTAGTRTPAATIRNTGRRPGTQVIQRYARVLVAGLLRRRAVLAGYGRIILDADLATEVRVAVEPDALPCPGIPPGAPGSVLLWLSISAAGEPVDPVVVTVGGLADTS
jgi:hypothetical protein